MLRKDIIDAWAKIRKSDCSIPDEVLDFMKNAALSQLPEEEEADGFKVTIDDGYCAWQYKLKDNGDTSIQQIMDVLFKHFKSPKDSGKMLY